MKKIYLLIVSMILMVYGMDLNAQVNQDWKWSHPFPQGNSLRWIKMLDANNWYAVGYAGTFMKTTNAGGIWTVYTNAGGWQPTYAGQGRILYSGWFFNANTGLVCGSSGWLARTSNGGLSWDSLASPTANALYGLQFVNSNVGFAGGASGTVLKTVDGGLNWSLLVTGITTTIYNIYAADSNNIYAPTTAGNVRISTNSGSTWTSYATGTSFTIYDANFVDANTGMVCGTAGNIKLTTNGGLNWTSINSTYTGTCYELLSKTVSSPPSTPYSEGFESATFPPTGWLAINVLGSYVWERSTAQYNSGVASAFINYETSGGEDWLITPKWNITSGDSLSFWWKNLFSSAYPPDSLIIKVSTTDSNIASFTTTILALNTATTPYTWTRYAASLNAFAGQNVYIAFRHKDTDGNGGFLDDVAVNRQGGTNAEFYMVGDASNLYKTTNLGTNWITIPYNDPLQSWTSTYYTVDVNNTNIAVGGTSGLLMKSTNSGANWTCLTTWLSPGIKYDVRAQYNNGRAIVVGAPGITGTTFDQILGTTNGGTNWFVLSNNSWATFYSVYMSDANTGFVCGSLGALRKTTNGGANWDSIPGPFAANILRRMEFVNASTGFIFQSSAAANGAFKTTDGGNTWNALTNFGTIDSRGYASSFINANTGYVGNYVPKLLKTTDGGNNWVSLDNTPMGAGYIYGVKFFNANTGYACGTAGARLCRTTDGGTSFDTIPLPVTSSLYTMYWTNPSFGWVFGSNGFAGKTINGGQSWQLNNTSGSTPYGCNMTSVDSGFVVGSSGYIHKISRFATDIEWKSQIPSTYYLKQNYPNPFNPTTTIEFAIPKAGFVSLKIYDITGREINNAINMSINPGIIKYMFNGANYASGVYFYRLMVDGKQIDTKKMVLVK